MRVEIGDKVIENTAFGYVVKVVTSRTKDSIATKHLNGAHRFWRVRLCNFRIYDKAKADRILQLEADIGEKCAEQRELYMSLDKAE